jgi:hypothetical protein
MLSQEHKQVIAVLICVAVWCGLQSKRSSKPPISPSGQDQGGVTAAEKHSSENLEWTNWTHDPIAVFTAVLTGFNGLLFLSTTALWLATRKSAKISERALTELEAPFVSVKINRPGLEIEGHSVKFGILRWCVVNYGRTPATILEIWDQTKSTSAGLPAKIDPHSTVGAPMPYGIVAPPNGECEEFPFVAISELVTEGSEPFSQKLIFFMGFVRYSDIFKNRFVLGFCFMFDRVGNRWILAGGDGYNYCRKEAGGNVPDWYQPTARIRSVRADTHRAIRESERDTASDTATPI